MRFLYPYMLGFLILIPLILLLYMIKQKTEKQRISAVFLWNEAYKNLRADTPWEKLKHNLLMYLQLSAMLVLAAALAAPYISGEVKSYKHSIIVLDNSAGMQADYADGLSRLEAAKEAASDYISSLPAETRVTVISSAGQAYIRLNEAANRESAKEALQAVGQTMLPGDAMPAMDICRSLALQWDEGGEDNYEAVVFSDAPVDFGTLNGIRFDFSSEGENASVDYVSHTLEGNTFSALARVSNRGTEENTVYRGDLSLYLEDELLEVRPVEINQGESGIVYFSSCNLPEEYRKKGGKLETEGLVFHAELSRKDALAADNIGYGICRTDSAGTVLLATEQNVFLEKALQTYGNVELYKTPDPESAREGKFDLYIFDGIFPKKLPEDGNMILINPEAGTYGWLLSGEKIQAEGGKSGYLTFREHPVSRYLEDYTLGASRYRTYDSPAWADTFLSETEGKGAVGFIGSMGGRTTAVLGFDLHEGDFPLQGEFPVFMYHLLGKTLERRLTDAVNVTAGQNIEITPLSDEEAVAIIRPDGSRDSWDKAGMTVLYPAEQTGIYMFSQETAQGKVTEHAAVNYPAQTESDLKSREADRYTEGGTAEDGAVTAAESHPLHDPGLPFRDLLLVLALFLLLFITLTVWGQAGIKFYRQIPVLRVLAAALIILALFDLTIVRRDPSITTIYLVDVSESMQGSKEQAEEFIKEADRLREAGDRMAVVAFGGDSRVEQFVTKEQLFRGLGTSPVKSATNLEQAVQTAMSIFPESGAKRIVLLSDGGENSGNVQNTVNGLLGSEVGLKVHKLSGIQGEETYISDITLPPKVEVGNDFLITVKVESNIRTGALLHLYEGSREKAVKEVELQPGSNQYVFTDTRTEGGLVAYRAIIEAGNDSITANNEYMAFTNAESKAKFLLLEESFGESAEFQKVLTAAGAAFEVKTAAAAPQTVLEMTEYKGILLADVPVRALPRGFMDQIESYVKDYAGGFAATGGQSSFALGGYRDTPLEMILPVDMDLKNEAEIPSLSMAFVIDHSGSMSPGDGTGGDKLETAKASALEGAKNLRDIDRLGVLAFDDTYTWVLPLTGASEQAAVKAAVSSIGAGGGTNIFPALNEAYIKIKDEPSKLKHIILLTDGQDGFRAYGDLMEQMGTAGITLSTVAVGSDADTIMLEKLAKAGGGRYYLSKDSSGLPDIFAQEVYLSMGEYLVNREFTPVVSGSSDILSAVAKEGMPKMYGYVASTLKPLGTAHLVSDSGDPLLSTWQYGLGRTAAFNSDVFNQWTAEYAGTAEYAALWRNILDWIRTDTAQDDGVLTTKREGNKVKFSYETAEYTAATTVEATYTGEDGAGRKLELVPTAPGRYEGEADLEDASAYSVFLAVQEDGSLVSGSTTGLALQYSKEYQFVTGEALDEFVQRAGGSFITEPKEIKSGVRMQGEEPKSITNLLLTAAVLIFFLDILMLRFHLHPMRIFFLQVRRKRDKAKTVRVLSGDRRKTGAAGAEKGPSDHGDTVKDTVIPEEGEGRKKPRAGKSQAAAELLDVSTLLKKKEERKY